jgi:hypothetical protein
MVQARFNMLHQFVKVEQSVTDRQRADYSWRGLHRAYSSQVPPEVGDCQTLR